jgi:recombination protein RecA
MSNNAEKLKAPQLTIDKLDKTYGKGTVMESLVTIKVDIQLYLPFIGVLDILWV